MWDPYSVGSLLYRDPVLGDSAVWGPCCAETLLCGYSAVQGFSSGGGGLCIGTLLQEDPAVCGYPVWGDPGVQRPCFAGSPV